jgi:hypothetical protein
LIRNFYPLRVTAKLTAFNVATSVVIPIADLYDMKLTPNKTVVFEGDTVTVVFTVNGVVPDGTPFEYELIFTENVTYEDFYPSYVSAEGTFVTLSKRAEKTFILSMDEKLEPTNEFFTIRLKRYKEVSATIQILDRYRGMVLKPNYDKVIEGGFVTFTLIDLNNNFPDYTSFKWDIITTNDSVKGFALEDLNQYVGDLGGFSLINHQATRTFAIKIDTFAEGEEIFTLRLADYPDIYANVTIYDSGKQIVLYADRNEVEEGDQVIFHVMSDILPDGFELLWEIKLTNMTVDDFYPTRTETFGTFVFKDGRAQRIFNLKSDWLTEGEATITMSLPKFPGIIRVVTVKDRYPKVEDFRVNKTTVIEGEPIIVDVILSNFEKINQVLYRLIPWTPPTVQNITSPEVVDFYSIPNQNTKVASSDTIIAEGNIAIYNGTGRLVLTPIPDYKDEMPELFSIILPDYPSTRANIIITDVSHALKILTDKEEVEEGDIVTFILTGNEDVGYVLTNETTYDFEIRLPSRSLTNFDFKQLLQLSKGQYQGTFLTRNNYALRTFYIEEDYMTEGPETLTIRLTDFPEVYKTINIIDTSMGVGTGLIFKASATTVNEGGTLQLLLYPGTLPIGTKITYTVTYQTVR